jgi:ornithine carbamoyltransferase
VPNLFDVDDLDPGAWDRVLTLARATPPRGLLAGQGVALYFAKPSARTRSSTEMPVVDLGGHPVYIQSAEVGLDERECAEDVARTLASYHRVLCTRVFDHGVLLRMASALEHSGFEVPVVNLLSDDAHPCQAVADVLTMSEVLGPLRGRALAYLGDASNMARSLAKAGLLEGMEVRIASPVGYAAVPYAAAWTGMGQEVGQAARRTAFEGFAVDEELVESAAADAVVLHCLPARRGEEITDRVMDGPRSAVWRQAAHRRTAMRGILAWALEAAA